MEKLQNWFERTFLPARLREGPSSERRNARVALAAIVAGTVVTVTMSLARASTGRATPLLVPSLCSLGLLLFALRRGRIRLVGHGLTFFALAIITALVALAGGITAYGVFTLPIVPLLALLIRDRRAGLLWAGAASLIIGCFALIHVADLALPVRADPGRQLPAVAALMFLWLVTAIGVAFDTAREELDRSLIRKERETRAILDSLPDSLFLLLPDDRLTLVHAAHEGMWPTGPAPLTEFFPEVGDAEALRAELRRDTFATVSAIDPETGEQRRIELRYSQLEGNLLIAARDETERHELVTRVADISMRAALERADRMASLGMMAASVAHELNNPLASTAGNIDYAINELALANDLDTGVITNALLEAREGVGHAARVVADLRVYTRREGPERGPTSLREAALSALRMAENDISHRASIVRRLDEDGLIEGEMSRLVQVVINFLVNAAQAMPTKRVEANQIILRTGKEPGGRVFVEVSDNGTGISAEVLARLREPFFTTKPPETGTGLGLTICDQIVKSHDGNLSFESSPGQGTRVRASFPPIGGLEHRDRASGSNGSSPKEAVPLWTADEPAPPQLNVLIVDDEAAIRRMLERLLKAHKTTTCANGELALEILGDAEPEAFDLVLCDLTMPGMSGVEVYDALVRSSAPVHSRVVFITGGALDPKLAQRLGDFEAQGRVLFKPFGRAELLDLVRRFQDKAV